jgi:hypothetical protein
MLTADEKRDRDDPIPEPIEPATDNANPHAPPRYSPLERRASACKLIRTECG